MSSIVTSDASFVYQETIIVIGVVDFAILHGWEYSENICTSPVYPRKSERKILVKRATVMLALTTTTTSSTAATLPTTLAMTRCMNAHSFHLFCSKTLISVCVCVGYFPLSHQANHEVKKKYSATTAATAAHSANLRRTLKVMLLFSSLCISFGVLCVLWRNRRLWTDFDPLARSTKKTFNFFFVSLVKNNTDIFVWILFVSVCCTYLAIICVSIINFWFSTIGEPFT